MTKPTAMFVVFAVLVCTSAMAATDDVVEPDTEVADDINNDWIDRG